MEVLYKQKTAYEFRLSLVGTEMSLRGRRSHFESHGVLHSSPFGIAPSSAESVSYTPLTLPTTPYVEISAGAVSLSSQRRLLVWWIFLMFLITLWPHHVAISGTIDKLVVLAII